MRLDKMKYWTVAVAGFLFLTAALNIEKVLELVDYLIQISRPLAFGVLIALALDGPADGFQKLLRFKGRDCGRTVAVIAAAVSVSIIAVGACYLILPNLVQSVERLAARAPDYAAEISGTLQEFSAKFGLKLDFTQELLPGEDLQKYASAVALTLMDLIGGLFRFFLSVVFAIYLLIRKHRILAFLERLNRAFTSSPVCVKIYQYVIDFARTFKQFVNGQVIEGVILGGLCFAGMLIIGLPYAALISVLIALTSLIPVIGAYLGAVPAALLLLLENPVQALIFLVYLIALQQFEGSVIYPKVVGDAIGLDGLLVFAGVAIGAGFGGILGVVLGVPLTAVAARVINGALTKRENGDRGTEQ